MAELLPLLLGAHIVLAIGLLLPSILLPFALRARRATTESANRVVQALLWAQTRGTIVVGVGLALTGAGLVLGLGAEIIRQPWLLVALAIYGTNLVIAFFVQRPSLRRLIGIRATSDDRVWQGWARRQRYMSYLMAGLVGSIGFLMSSKPVLW